MEYIGIFIAILATLFITAGYIGAKAGTQLRKDIIAHNQNKRKCSHHACIDCSH